MVVCACIHVYMHLQEEVRGWNDGSIASYFLNHFRLVVPANTSSSCSDIIPDLECIFDRTLLQWKYIYERCKSTPAADTFWFWIVRRCTVDKKLNHYFKKWSS